MLVVAFRHTVSYWLSIHGWNWWHCSVHDNQNCYGQMHNQHYEPYTIHATKCVCIVCQRTFQLIELKTQSVNLLSVHNMKTLLYECVCGHNGWDQLREYSTIVFSLICSGKGNRKLFNYWLAYYTRLTLQCISHILTNIKAAHNNVYVCWITVNSTQIF